MKKQVFLFGLLAVFLPFTASAITQVNPGGGVTPMCTNVSSCGSFGGVASVYTPTLPSSCATQAIRYYMCGSDCIGIRQCTTCSGTAQLITQTMDVAMGTYSATYNSCSADCSGGCPDCESTNWSVPNLLNVSKRTLAQCNEITCQCSKETVYGCAAGYYGKPTSLTPSAGTGCNRCPQNSDDGQYGTSDIGSLISASCYITSGTDTTGSYSFDPPNCQYSQM